MSWKEEDKLGDELAKYKKYCSCGHSVIVLPTRKRDDFVECTHCRKLVYLDDIKQQEYEKKLKREEFRVNVWKGLRK